MCVCVYVCMCMYVCTYHWAPGRVAFRLKAVPVKIRIFIFILYPFYSTIALSLYRIVLVVYACIYSTFGYAQISWLHNQLYVTVLHVFMISSIYRALKKL